MTVLVVLAVLAAIATPRYSKAMVLYRADAGARRVAADLNLAARRARATRAAVTVTFSSDHHTVRVSGLTDLNAPLRPYVTRLANEPYRCRISSADLGGDGQVTFSGFGLPDSDGKVVVASGKAVRTILLSRSGEAEVQ